MVVTLDEAKTFLRLDGNEEDVVVTCLLMTAEKLCKDILRVDDVAVFRDSEEPLKTAILYALTYMFENREQADHHALVLTLRSLLFGIREDKF